MATAQAPAPSPSPATDKVIPLTPEKADAPKKVEPWRLWAGGSIIALGLGGALVWVMFPSAEAVDEPAPLAPASASASLGAPQAQVMAGPAPIITLSPDNLTLEPGKRGTAVVTIGIEQAPAVIRSVRVVGMDADLLNDTGTVDSPFADAGATAPSGPFHVKSNCPAPPAALQPGGGCSVSIEYTGAPTGAMRFVVDAERSGGGSPTTVQALISPVETQAPAAPIDLGAGGPSQPAQAYAPPPAPQVIYGPSAQEAYLERVRRAPIRATSFQARPITGGSTNPYASWDAIGAEATESSLPVDMSRTLTPDRPISAVLVNPINTAATVTAVAMVDRDIYGAADRRVLLPRGTRIIGRVAGADTRVGIQWSQIIRPDGVRFVFEAESGDAMGRGGVPGRKRERLAERYGWSTLASAVTAGITVALGGRRSTTAAGGQTTETTNSRAEAADILRAEAERISGDVFSRAQQIQPEIAVPAGTRITVWALTDLRLKPVPPRGQRAVQANTSPMFGNGDPVGDEEGEGRGGALPSTGRSAGRQGGYEYADPGGLNYLPDGTPTVADTPFYSTSANRQRSSQSSTETDAGMAAAPRSRGFQTPGNFGGVRATRPVPAAPRPEGSPASSDTPPWAR